MARRAAAGTAVLWVLAAAAVAFAAPPVHHDLKAVLDPEAGRVSLRDTVSLPEDRAGSRGVFFLLHQGLSPSCATPGAVLERVARAAAAADFGLGSEAGLPGSVPSDLFRLTLPEGTRAFTLSYEGEFRTPLEERGREYARGFQETPGLVAPEGVYLSGASLWYPWFGEGTVTFELRASAPPGWRVVSQGQALSGEANGWACFQPQDEIFLVGGPLTEYEQKGGPTAALAFLRKPDPALASRYLRATGRYVDLYSKLIAPYPYPKFAVVENFWETGYGMPSFTLLGSSILRFPFILNTSYAHEILHNWWGNSVYVRYEEGNWAEGLTAYLSDHLLDEQKGEGAAYREATLQKYADYVTRGRDFPLTEFRSRHSSATEAVGYGKSLLFFHMLRRRLGDAVFREALARLYGDQKYRFASFDDVRTSFERASGQALGEEFRQWVERSGAPSLRVRMARAKGQGSEYVLRFALEQSQREAPYALRVPVAVTLDGAKEAYQTEVELTGRKREVELKLVSRPLRLDVDPEVDVFRRLDPNEIPPALSGIFGSSKPLVVLPAAAGEALLAAYRELARSFPDAELRLDRELRRVPTGRPVWLFGWENRFLRTAEAAVKAQGGSLGAKGVTLAGTLIPREGRSVALAARHPDDPAQPLAFLATTAPAALPGLGRKLPHYHKWSYLAFEGDEPVNTLKGRWKAVRSPMTVLLAGAPKGLERAALAPRPPLAPVSSVFSAQLMEEIVRRLASPELEGRGFGSRGLEEAAQFLSERFRALGLEPGGDGGSYFQSWTQRGGEPERDATLRNVLGVLPAAKPGGGSPVVVSAHYDHLGLGWPGARKGDAGSVFPGADDNASGVAVLLEVARVLAAGPRLDRPVLFALFSGEEAGRRGSRHFVSSLAGSGPLADVNLDTVGRLEERKLLVLGSGTAREWGPLIRAAATAAAVPAEEVEADAGGSDQVSFLEAGVPGVQLFAGPNLDYHRPTDTPDKIDYPGMAAAAALTTELVVALSAVREPLTFSAAPPRAGGSPAERRVSLGTIPDFAYSGKGVKLSGTAPNSPAARAGLAAGDVVVRLDGEEVYDLRSFSERLKTLSPGQTVRLGIVREGQEREVNALLEER